MAWSEPQYTRGAIERAGRALNDPTISAEDRRAAVAVVNNWRSSHGFPLNTLTVSLRERAQRVNSEVLVAQRIKRLPSIQKKLARFPKMNVARMQDLGGCRAVLASVDEVDQVVDLFLNAQHKHKLVRHDNYIASPKESGYRGHHLVYSYRSDRRQTFNNLTIEVQIRSQLQHAWATAVETVDLFTTQALKSSVGEKEWLRFFQLMASVIALREGTVPLKETGGNLAALKHELSYLDLKLSIIERLTSYAQTLNESETQIRGARFVTLSLDVMDSRLSITGYRSQDEAAAAYALLESEAGEDVDVVLVSAGSIQGLRAAYPNYFLDTTRFVEVLDSTLYGD